jgi:hypothetical protein
MNWKAKKINRITIIIIGIRTGRDCKKPKKDVPPKKRLDKKLSGLGSEDN